MTHVTVLRGFKTLANANGANGVWFRYTIGTVIMIATFFGGIFIGPPIVGSIKDSSTIVEHGRRITKLENFAEQGDRWTMSQELAFQGALDDRLHRMEYNQQRICEALEIKCAEIQ